MRPAVLARHLVTVLRGAHGPPAVRARWPRTARAWLVALPLLGACVDSPTTPGGPAPLTPVGASPFMMMLTLDEVWTGAVDTDWFTAGNWNPAAVPGSTNGVDIPDDSLGNHVFPVLTADTEITDLRVGFASTLGLGGFTLRSLGNVDAIGTISNGTLRMSSATGVLAGSVGSLTVDGRVSLERPVVATGPVAVSGMLTNQGQFLSIQVP